MAEFDDFTRFVNGEVPKRISTEDDPLNVQAGHIPVSTGTGLAVEFTNPVDIPGLKGEDGEPGKSAYQVALDGGFVGTEQEWLDSLEGEQGVQGIPGEPGPALKILDSVTQDDFEENIEPYDTWEIGSSWFVMSASATILKVWGYPDPDEPEAKGKWITTDDMRGPAGTGLIIRGQWPDNQDLPHPAQKGDTYGWKQALWTYMLQAGLEDIFPDNYIYVQVVPEGPEGPRGIQGVKGDKGDKGDQGDAGTPALPYAIVAELADQSELPAVGESLPEEAYAVTVDDVLCLFVFSAKNNQWMNLGTWTGPKGANGPKGDKGDKGDTGERGPAGTNGRNVVIANTYTDYAQLIANLSLMQADKAYGVNSTNTLYYATIDNPTEDDLLNLGSFRGPQGAKGDKGDQGVKGDKGDTGDGGKNLVVKGTQPTLADIQGIQNPEEQDAWVARDNLHLYMYIGGVWTDLGTHQGAKGDKGDQGIQGETGPRGLKGDKGDKGDVGDPIEIIAIVDSIDELPAPSGSTIGKSAVVRGGNMYYNQNGTAWVDLGPAAVKGDKGDAGVGVRIIGEVDTSADLPNLNDPENAELVTGDAYISTFQKEGVDAKGIYIVNRDTNTYDGPYDLQGPQGETGPKGEKGDQGEIGQGIKLVGDYADFASLQTAHPTSSIGDAYSVGEVGSKVLYVWAVDGSDSTEKYLNLGPFTVGVKGDKGDKGDQGDVGPRGATGQKGPAGSRWVILPSNMTIPNNTVGVENDWCLDKSGKVWYRDSSGWKEFIQLLDVPVPEVETADQNTHMVRYQMDWVPLPGGVIDSPQEGVQYVQEGQADGSTTWVELQLPGEPVDDIPDSDPDKAKAHVRVRGEWKLGAPITVGLDSSKTYLMKTTGWVLSDVYAEAPSDTTAYGRRGGNWVGVTEEAPTDAKLYGRQGKAWVEVPAAIIASDAVDAKTYGRTKGSWVELKIIAEPSADGKTYGRSTTAGGVSSWVEITKTFDVYTLKSSTVSANVTVDYATQQCYVVDVSAAPRQVTLNAGPSGRMVTSVLLLKGNAATNKPTFVAGTGSPTIVFNDGVTAADIEYGSNKTVMTALWDGETTWIIARGAAY